jgi:GTP-binding protein HflX
VFVIFSKFDKIHSEQIEEISKDLEISNPVAISSKTGYGIHKLKTMIEDHIVN